MGWVKDKGNKPLFKEGGKVKYKKGGKVFEKGDSPEGWHKDTGPPIKSPASIQTSRNIRTSKRYLKEVQDELYKRGAQTSEKGETITPKDKKKKLRTQTGYEDFRLPPRHKTNKGLIKEEKKHKKYLKKYNQ